MPEPSAPPPLPPPPLPEGAAGQPKAKSRSGLFSAITISLIIATMAAVRSGGLLAMPLYIGFTLVPLLWIRRLWRAVRLGVITCRIRTGSRTTMMIGFTISGKPDIFHRKSQPVRFWAAWVIEIGLFLFITAFFWVVAFGTIIEGGPK